MAARKDHKAKSRTQTGRAAARGKAKTAAAPKTKTAKAVAQRGRAAKTAAAKVAARKQPAKAPAKTSAKAPAKVKSKPELAATKAAKSTKAALARQGAKTTSASERGQWAAANMTAGGQQTARGRGSDKPANAVIGSALGRNGHAAKRTVKGNAGIMGSSTINGSGKGAATAARTKTPGGRQGGPIANPGTAPVKMNGEPVNAKARAAGEAGVSNVVLPTGYRPTDSEPFMNERQRVYFRMKLLAWKDEIVRQNRETLQGLHEDSAQHADVADRATFETDRALELRARDRQRKLVAKIDAALARIEEGTYGYCEETGEPIGLKRLDARPIATLSIEAQERHERRERVFRDE